MKNFEETSRDNWDNESSVYSVESYRQCSDYFDETMRGFKLRVGLGTTKVNLAHRSLTIGSSQIDFVDFHCDKGFRVDQPDEFDYYYIKLVQAGQCEIVMGDQAVVIRKNQAAAINPFGSLTVNWPGECEQVLIRLDRNALEQTLAEELDIKIEEPIRFNLMAVSHEEAQATSALINLLRRDADKTSIFWTWRIGRQYERLIHLAALHCFPNNYSDTLSHATSMIAPYYIRKAEEYLKTNLREEMTIEDVASVTGVSTRSLYYGFRRWRNTTPMAYLKKIRLDEARRILRSAAYSGQTVTEIAMSVGFFHLSRFSSQYKARFGESPSVTLRRG